MIKSFVFGCSFIGFYVVDVVLMQFRIGVFFSNFNLTCKTKSLIYRLFSYGQNQTMKPTVLVDWLSRPLPGVPEEKRILLLDQACLKAAGDVPRDQMRVFPDSNNPILKRLTPRQREVLGYLAQGKLRKEIADIMGLSLNTVGNYCTQIYHLIGVHNKVEAARVIISIYTE